MALRKYDPIANAHVIFYEAKLPVWNRRLRQKRIMAYARWTGERQRDLLKAVEKKVEKTGYF